MTRQEILNRNKEIALMLGLHPLTKPYDGAFQALAGKTHNAGFYTQRMEGDVWFVYPKYDNDWNWLMEAVDFAFSKRNEPNEINIVAANAGISNTLLSTNIFEVFVAVSNFASLYNQRAV